MCKNLLLRFTSSGILIFFYTSCIKYPDIKNNKTYNHIRRHSKYHNHKLQSKSLRSQNTKIKKNYYMAERNELISIYTKICFISGGGLGLCFTLSVACKLKNNQKKPMVDKKNKLGTSLTSTDPRTIKLISWNVWFKPLGRCTEEKNRRIKFILEEINKCNPDIVCLQEVDATILKIIKKNKHKKYTLVENNLKSNYTTLILVKNTYHKKSSTTTKLSYNQGRSYLKAKFHLPQQNIDLDIGNIHLESLPNGYNKRTNQINTIFKDTSETSHFIILRDTNFLNKDKDLELPEYVGDAYLESDRSQSEKRTYDGLLNSNVSFQDNKRELRWPPARFDRIFFNKNKFKIKKFKLLKSQYLEADKYYHPSDHFGVYAELVFL